MFVFFLSIAKLFHLQQKKKAGLGKMENCSITSLSLAATLVPSLWVCVDMSWCSIFLMSEYHSHADHKKKKTEKKICLYITLFLSVCIVSIQGVFMYQLLCTTSSQLSTGSHLTELQEENEERGRDECREGENWDGLCGGRRPDIYSL